MLFPEPLILNILMNLIIRAKIDNNLAEYYFDAPGKVIKIAVAKVSLWEKMKIPVLF